jgi:tetratricopeptide (TPR) repeat protein
MKHLSTVVIAAVSTVVLMSVPASRLAAQRLALPPGKLDSAALQNPLQMIDFVYSDDRPKAAQLFTELLAREADIAPNTVVELRYMRAVALSEQDSVLTWYRELARIQGGDFVYALPRMLLAVGDYSEALDLARRWRPAPGAAARPLREEIEASVARMRGDHRTALDASRALRRFPGQALNASALGRELAALAKLTSPTKATAEQRALLAALLDTALATAPRGFRVDPVLVFSSYGDAMRDAGHTALAAKAWRRALAVLDSTAPRAADRGPLARDSIRVNRGRLLFALGQYADARPLLQSPSGRRDDREQLRQAWLAVSLQRLGDTNGARRVDGQLAVDTSYALRGITAVARAIIAESLGEWNRGAGYLALHRDAIDLRTLQSQWLLSRTLSRPQLQDWLRGR